MRRGVPPILRPPPDGLRLNVSVVRLDGVDNVLVLVITPCKVSAYRNVGALDLVAYSLSDIVEKTCTLCKGGVYAELVCENACDMCDLKRMNEHVLTVARSVS